MFELTAVEHGTKVAVTETRGVGRRRHLRMSVGAMWDDRHVDLERHCLTRQFALV